MRLSHSSPFYRSSLRPVEVSENGRFWREVRGEDMVSCFMLGLNSGGDHAWKKTIKMHCNSYYKTYQEITGSRLREPYVDNLRKLCRKVSAPIEFVRKAVRKAGFTNNMGRPWPISILASLEDAGIIKCLSVLVLKAANFCSLHRPLPFLFLHRSEAIQFLYLTNTWEIMGDLEGALVSNHTKRSPNSRVLLRGVADLNASSPLKFLSQIGSPRKAKTYGGKENKDKTSSN
ncbi:hypothetical protein D5086_028905 [Populus alba]|uniref:Uncharacterized protein n=1 Tax=Populus alba TaxID=43335 RepID=A0ACC4AS61_POPAL